MHGHLSVKNVHFTFLYNSLFRFSFRADVPKCAQNTKFNRLTPNDSYMCRTAPLTSKRCILRIYSTNIGTEYFNPLNAELNPICHLLALLGAHHILHLSRIRVKHALYSPFSSLQNAVCFIMLTCLVPVLLTFYIQDVLKLKKNNSGAKRLSLCGTYSVHYITRFVPNL